MASALSLVFASVVMDTLDQVATFPFATQTLLPVTRLMVVVLHPTDVSVSVVGLVTTAQNLFALRLAMSLLVTSVLFLANVHVLKEQWDMPVTSLLV